MKIITFNVDMRLNKEDEFEVIEKNMLPYSEENIEYAVEHSIDGKYSIEELEDIVEEPTQLDRIESQVAYLAMMTGNEDILEV